MIPTRSSFLYHKMSIHMMPENLYATDNADFEHLLSMGFSETEATKLVYMKDHVTEKTEYREMVEELHRLDFMRWLVEHDRLEK